MKNENCVYTRLTTKSANSSNLNWSESSRVHNGCISSLYNFSSYWAVRVTFSLNAEHINREMEFLSTKLSRLWWKTSFAIPPKIICLLLRWCHSKFNYWFSLQRICHVAKRIVDPKLIIQQKNYIGKKWRRSDTQSHMWMS